MSQFCYRHPDRETGVSCSRCDRPICTDCMTTSPVGMHCPECAGQRTPVRTAASIGRSAGAPVTYALMAIVALVFLAEAGGGGGALGAEGGGRVIRDWGLYGPAVDRDGEWWRLLTGGFLHAGPLHLLMNMFVLYVLGTLLEPAVGSARFAGIYATSLLAGSCGALLLDPDVVTVGASGAVYGLMAATFLIARRRGVEQVASQIGFWLVINLAFTLSVPGISLGGHAGGLAGGALAAVVLLAAERLGDRREAAGAALFGLAALSAVSVAVALWAAGQPAGL